MASLALMVLLVFRKSEDEVGEDCMGGDRITSFTVRYAVIALLFVLQHCPAFPVCVSCFKKSSMNATMVLSKQKMACY